MRSQWYFIWVAVTFIFNSTGFASTVEDVAESITHGQLNSNCRDLCLSYEHLKLFSKQGKHVEGNQVAELLIKEMPRSHPYETMLYMCGLAEYYIISRQPEKVKSLLFIPCSPQFLKDCVLESHSVFPYFAWSAILHCAGLYEDADRFFKLGYNALQVDTDRLFMLTEHAVSLSMHLGCDSGGQFLTKYPNRETFMSSQCPFIQNLKKDLSPSKY